MVERKRSLVSIFRKINAPSLIVKRLAVVSDMVMVAVACGGLADL